MGAFKKKSYSSQLSLFDFMNRVDRTKPKPGRRVYKVLHLFCGIGGGALGFQQAEEDWRGMIGEYETLCGIDVNPAACEDFEMLTGAPAIVMDLFSREQYIMFHGEEPPEDWHEVTPHDIWRACNYQSPDVIFFSPPCKGFTGLLPEEQAKSDKYVALNQLTVRGIELCMQAFGHDLPSLVLMENVPRISSKRGRILLDKVIDVLQKNRYAMHEGSHNCGELGGGEHLEGAYDGGFAGRKRFLLVGRNLDKVQNYVYRPPLKKMNPVGKLLETLPLPGDTVNGGPMHRMPRLQWKVWVRLAMIPAGKDWKALQNIDMGRYRIYCTYRNGGLQVSDWEQPTGAVTGGAGFGRSNGAQAIADLRSVNVLLADRESRHANVYKVVRFDEASPCVTGSRFGSGALAVADPRINCKPRSGTYGIVRWDESAKTIIGAGDIHAGAVAVADPRDVDGEDFGCEESFTLPKDTENGDFFIIAPDGTRHRPFTTYELAMLQTFPRYLPDGRPFQLCGNRDADHRDRIGNAVPPAAARAIAKTMLTTLLSNEAGEWLMSHEAIWVRPGVDDDHETDYPLQVVRARFLGSFNFGLYRKIEINKHYLNYRRSRLYVSGHGDSFAEVMIH